MNNEEIKQKLDRLERLIKTHIYTESYKHNEKEVYKEEKCLIVGKDLKELIEIIEELNYDKVN